MKCALALALTLMAFTSIVRAQSSNVETSVDGEPVAYVEKLAGSVFVDRGEGFAAIVDRTALASGDRVAIPSESSARLSYPGNCETALGERQIHVVSLDSCVGDPNAPAITANAIDDTGPMDALDTGNIDAARIDGATTGPADLNAVVGSFLIFEDSDFDFPTPENIGRLRPIGP